MSPERRKNRRCPRLQRSGGKIISGPPKRIRFDVDPTACAVLVEARSNVGAVSFGSSELGGVLELVRLGDGIDLQSPPCAHVTIPLASLTSGNALYDAELQQRLSAQRFPTVTLELLDVLPSGASDYPVSGAMTLHGVTAQLHGSVHLSFPDPRSVLLTGTQVVDVRDFGIDLPSVLMLRIYPDVKVSLHLLARESAGTEKES